MASNSPPSLVVIDLDGVLADTFKIHVEGWELVMTELGFWPDVRVVDDLRGVPTRAALEILCQRIGITYSAGLLSELERIKNEVRDDAIERLSRKDVLHGARTFLSECHNAGVKTVCVATSTAAPRVIERLGLDDLLNDTRYGDIVHPPKASSSAYIQTLLAEYRVATRAALVLDDGWVAVAHCLQAGIPAVVIGEEPTQSEHAHGNLIEGIEVLYERGKAGVWS